MTAQGIEAAQADETRSGSAVGESPTRRDAPPSLPPTGEGLPEEIVKAIRHLTSVCVAAPGFNDAVIANRNIRNGVEALDATILHHLSAARAERDQARGEVENMKAMRKRLDRRIHMQRKAWRDTWETVEMRMGVASRARDWRYGRKRHEEAKAAETALSAARARAERAEKALRVAQSALAMLTEPNEIRSTSVANAWAVAVDAELKCRQALAGRAALSNVRGGSSANDARASDPVAKENGNG